MIHPAWRLQSLCLKFQKSHFSKFFNSLSRSIFQSPRRFSHRHPPAKPSGARPNTEEPHVFVDADARSIGLASLATRDSVAAFAATGGSVRPKQQAHPIVGASSRRIRAHFGVRRPI